jgi:hypothetical protein
VEGGKKEEHLVEGPLAYPVNLKKYRLEEEEE